MSANKLSPPPRIAIVGGGPGGLTLARLLEINGLPAVVYERESSSSTRFQGGSLDLHPETGQLALQEAGLFQEFKSVARYEGQDFRLLDHTGKVYVNLLSTEDQTERPEVDRLALRELLLNSIDQDSIRWSHNLREVKRQETGKFDLHFENGLIEKNFDLVVGADGAWSRVRPLVSPATPTYSGVSMVEIHFRSVDTSNPKIARFVGRGSVFAFGEHKGLISQRNGDGSVRVYIAMKVPQNWASECGIDFNEPNEARKKLLSYYENWSEELKDLIRYCDPVFVPRSLYILPVGHRWDSQPGVTIIGDAAHLILPFAGEGVNLAMADALKLVQKILLNKNNFNKAIPLFEAEMFKQSGNAARDSMHNCDIFFGDNAAEKFVKLLVEKYNFPVVNTTSKL